MELGMIGLGRMGANLVRRLLRDGHQPVAYDLENPELEGFPGRVSDSGEGRWTVLSAEGVPAPLLSAALYGRLDARGRDEFANQALSAMRRPFGGHQPGPA